ncbi:SET domain-containing protein [Trametes coccinea BRFM310]|uniref:SET domain-containing protein n=1 Tax=Trametes coccinea (strain BRFM310) TaxID=1353009 RepID=A0A1Y2IEP6_TRAC3|nr:SET domain-containing protein [Trametes coccinea BRFM310]
MSNSAELRNRHYDNSRGGWVEASVIPESEVHVEPPSAYTAYESCTPIDQNILHGDDSNYMPFIPLADDPTFDHEDHAMEYKRLAWQEPYRDPDTLEITLETARRVQRRLHLSPEQLDSMGILPLTLSTTSVWGAIWTGKQRYELFRTLQTLSDVSPPLAGDLRSRLQDYLTLWCPTPDCTQAMCFSHSLEQAKLSLGSHRYRTGPFKRLPVTEPCGVDCTILKQSDDVEDVDWCPEDLDDLRSACIRMGCEAIISPSLSASEDPQDPNAYVRSPSSSPLVDTPPIHSTERCDHPGACRPDTKCACFVNQTPCSRLCRCSPECRRRWKGCRCAASSAMAAVAKRSKARGRRSLCRGTQCPCRAAKRECDPAVCLCSHDNASCRNTQIQTGASKLVEVKQGAFGLGLFLLEDARAGDLVTEYTGELIYEPTFLSRSQVSAHVGRSYVFGLNDVFSVDATNAGSPARFINHAPSRMANVAACILSVNGFQRIGVFAKKHIAAGSELFMDYGPEYPIGGEDENT